jgi:hypothetical protein
MIQDIIRALIQKIMTDKILMALIAIGIIGIFFTGVNHTEKAESVQSRRLGGLPNDPSGPSGQGTGTPAGQAQQGEDADGQGQKAGSQPGSQQGGQGQAQGGHAQGQASGAQATGAQAGQAQTGQANGGQAAAEGLTPQLASDFVRWWISKSMDYRMDTAAASHKEAVGWMLPDAASAFEQLYWGDHIKQGISSGQIVGSFQPVSIMPLATNPDGTVVVTVVGTLVIQQSGQQPAAQQITMDFLVKKSGDGCRIAAFFNRAVAPVAAH